MANVLTTLLTTVAATSNLITTVATRSDSIVNHSLGSLDEMAASMHDSAKMYKLTGMAERRKAFHLANPTGIEDVPKALQELLTMEIK